MSRRPISTETVINCGFESATERHLLSTIVADGFEQFWNLKVYLFPLCVKAVLRGKITLIKYNLPFNH